MKKFVFFNHASTHRPCYHIILYTKSCKMRILILNPPCVSSSYRLSKVESLSTCNPLSRKIKHFVFIISKPISKNCSIWWSIRHPYCYVNIRRKSYKIKILILDTLCVIYMHVRLSKVKTWPINPCQWEKHVQIFHSRFEYYL